MACSGGDNRLRLGPVKVILTMTTGQLQPDVDQLGEMVLAANQEGFPVAIHAIEQEAVAAAAQVFIKIGGMLPARLRNRIEHCAECPPALVEQVRRSGAIVVTQPGFIYWNGDRYRQEVAPRLLPHLYPAGSLRRAGAPVAFGSDAPVIDPNPWAAIYSAVTRQTRSGNGLADEGKEPAGDAQRVAVEAALRMYTSGAAYAEGTEGWKGTICAGKLADLVLVDADPFTTEPAQLKDIKVLLTMLDGKVAWNAGL